MRFCVLVVFVLWLIMLLFRHHSKVSPALSIPADQRWVSFQISKNPQRSAPIRQPVFRFARRKPNSFVDGCDGGCVQPYQDILGLHLNATFKDLLEHLKSEKDAATIHKRDVEQCCGAISIETPAVESRNITANPLQQSIKIKGSGKRTDQVITWTVRTLQFFGQK